MGGSRERDGRDEEGEEVARARHVWRVWSLEELAERAEEAFREEGGKGEGRELSMQWDWYWS